MVLAAPVLDGATLDGLVAVRWTAYQVVSLDGDRPAIVTLDWLADAPPTLEQARAAELLRLTHHNWKGALDYRYVSPGLPRSWRVIGALPVPALEPCNAQ